MQLALLRTVLHVARRTMSATIKVAESLSSSASALSTQEVPQAAQDRKAKTLASALRSTTEETVSASEADKSGKKRRPRRKAKQQQQVEPALKGGQKKRVNDSYGVVLWVAGSEAAQQGRPSPDWWFVLQESISRGVGDLKLDPLRGKLEDGESPAQAAARETFEESMACLDLEPASLGDIFDRQKLFHVRASLVGEGGAVSVEQTANEGKDKGEGYQHGSESARPPLVPAAKGDMSTAAGTNDKPQLVTMLEQAFAQNRVVLQRDAALSATLGIEVEETSALRGLHWRDVVSFSVPTKVELQERAKAGQPRLAKQVQNMLRDQALAWSKGVRPEEPGLLPIDLSSLPEISLTPSTTPHGLRTLGNRPAGLSRAITRRVNSPRRGYFRELSTMTSIRPDFNVPTGKILRQVDEGKQPVVLVSLGSFSPVTVMHLRLMEDARDRVDGDPKRQVVGGYLCPTHHKYGKASLAPMHHRINMVGLAVESSPWIDVDMWECAQEGWTPTALSLARLAKEMSKIPIAVGDAPPTTGIVKVMMVCGADLLGTFMDMKADGEPLWLPEHREIILGQNGIACLRRDGTDLDELIEKTDLFRVNRDNIVIVDAAATNVVSSTVVRRQLTMNKSIRYLVPDAVEDYIRRHSLHLLPNWQHS